MMLKKIAVLGPESTGKSTLSKKLARHYNTEWVPEFARQYIDQLGRPYEEKDLVDIAQGQLEQEDIHAKNASRLLICDTTLLVIKIWSEFKFGRCDPWILQQMEQRKYDLYLLTYIDLPWEDDPQREHPTRREELFQIYLDELNSWDVRYQIIKGIVFSERKRMAVEAISEIL